MLYRHRIAILPWTLLVTIMLGGTIPLAGCGKEKEYTPDALVIAVKDAINEDDPGLIWAALPASWQADINDLLHIIGNKIDAAAYDDVMNTVRRVVTVLKTKKEFILTTPMLQMVMAQGGEEAKAAMNNYDTVVASLSMFANSDLGTAKGLKKADLGRIMTKYGPELVRLGKQAIEIAKQQVDAARDLQGIQFLTDAANLTATVDSETGDTAQITIHMPQDEDETMSMTKIDNRWVPTDMAKEFSATMDMAKTALENADWTEINDGLKKVQDAMSKADDALSAMEKASTQEEFDNAIMQAMGTMMGGQ